ncbi:MAG: adenine phosphoribosyltransferase [Alphaproteobacteria bacterium]|nr:MAG: adenine phosphoribosyltransferase [Alphaproteobacteria bacterium]
MRDLRGSEKGTTETLPQFVSIEDWVKARIRTIPDFPKPGIQFRDITTLLADTQGFRKAVDELVQPYVGVAIDKIAGIEARGFILGGAVAHQLGCGFVPIRKPGKLPARVIRREYTLEYGTDALEMHEDAIRSGDHLLLVDDLIATGGTAMAAIDLIEAAGGKVLGACFVIDLPDLGGAEKLRERGIAVLSLCRFSGK